MKCVHQIITIMCVTYVQKNFKIQTLIISSYLQNINFLTKLPQISHIQKYHNFKV